MSQDRSPDKRRGGLPARPTPRPASFFETKDARRLRELENDAALKLYEEQLETLYRDIKQENVARELHNTIDRVKNLSDHAERVSDSKLSATMNAMIMEGWSEGQAARFRNLSQE